MTVKLNLITQRTSNDGLGRPVYTLTLNAAEPLYSQNPGSVSQNCTIATPQDIPNAVYSSLANAKADVISVFTSYVIGMINTTYGLSETAGDIKEYDFNTSSDALTSIRENISTALSANSLSFLSQANYAGMRSVLGVSASTRTFSNPTRSLNTAFQISPTQDTAVSYSVDVTTALSLTGGQAGTVYLRYADDSGHTANVKEVCRFSTSNTGTLTIGLALNQIATGTLSGMIPSSKYVKLVTSNDTGTPTFTYRNAQEVLF